MSDTAQKSKARWRTLLKYQRTLDTAQISKAMWGSTEGRYRLRHGPSHSSSYKMPKRLRGGRRDTQAQTTTKLRRLCGIQETKEKIRYQFMFNEMERMGEFLSAYGESARTRRREREREREREKYIHVKYWVRVLYTWCDVTQTWSNCTNTLRGISDSLDNSDIHSHSVSEVWWMAT